MILLQIFTHIRCVRNKSVLREERVDLFAGRHGRGRADALHGQGSPIATVRVEYAMSNCIHFE